ncbi:Radical SAM domain protein [Sediminispirochaeta smaragdinae DSM 11293]|uniref:Radical SAM domain protein n=2 Tax=Sediminispirochaeta TaxID=1911556 RepID=E1RCC6_SEDSS|nr:Radical SAM domain protein [Sediminispirochaeta smaragdinae DSM 11293]
MSSGMNFFESDHPVALFLSPPIYDFALYDLFLRPYGLLRVASWFQASGYHIRVVDALDPDLPLGGGRRRPKRKANGTGKFFRSSVSLPEGMAPIPRRYSRYGVPPAMLRSLLLDGPSPDVVFIASGMTYWYQGIAEVAALCRSLWQDIPIVVGGVYASLLPDHCNALPGVDLAIVGSPDTGSGAERLARLLRERALPVPEGAVPLFPLMHRAIMRNGAAPIRLNRGCPYRCDYCASHRLEPSWRGGDVELLFSYVRELCERYGVRNFAFYDDALLVDKERLFLPFLDMVLRKLPGLSFWTPNAMHLRFLDLETAILMRRAGFREARFGYESESEAFHLEHDGKFRPSEAARSFQALHQAGFKRSDVLLYVLGALPGQSKAELFSAIKGGRDSGFGVQVAEFSPVPGSLLWNTCVEQSRYPIDREPLYQNNSFMPMEWEGLRREDLEEAKRFARMG